MNKINTLAIYCLLIITVFGAGCSKDFLTRDPKGRNLESNYYRTREQLYSGLISAYSILSKEISNRSSSWYSSKLAPLNAAADECYAGGGNSGDIAAWQAMSDYRLLTETVGPQSGFWGNNYEGIYRANLVLQKIEGNIDDLTEGEKSRFKAEAKFLRAYFYFELVRLFGNIPLIIEPLRPDQWYNIEQTPSKDVYTQIEKDLNEAIADLPIIILVSEKGRVSKGAALALLGKVILFQNNEQRMHEAVQKFEELIGLGQYALLDNFGNIFDPNNKFHKESIFEIPHTSIQGATWEHSDILGNIYPTLIGPRGYSGPLYFGGGYGFNPIISEFAIEMKQDPRYPYTIANVDSIVTNTKGASYSPGYQNSGYFIQKFAPKSAYATPTGIVELNWPHNYIEIRLADVYLMTAEAIIRGSGRSKQTAQWYFDQVRKRVNLPSKAVNLESIYHERKMELATEGHRWYDLVRTGQAEKVLSFKGFKASKNELLPIPLAELNNTVLKQNPHY